MQRLPRSRQGFASSRKRNEPASLLSRGLLMIVIFLISLFIVRHAFLRTYLVLDDVEGLETGDRVVVSPMSYGVHVGLFRLPETRSVARGEIAALRAPDARPRNRVASILFAPVDVLTGFTQRIDFTDRRAWEEEIVFRRIVALPGDSVRYGDTELIVTSPDGASWRYNLAVAGEPLEERVLGDDEYYVLGNGDAQTTALDSRHWGPLSKADLIGRVFLRYWPAERFGAF